MFIHPFRQRHAKTVLLREAQEDENGCLVRQAVNHWSRGVAYEFNVIKMFFHGSVAEVIEHLHAVKSQCIGQAGREADRSGRWANTGLSFSPSASDESACLFSQDRCHV